MTAEIVSPRKNAAVKGRGLSPEQSAAAAMVAEARKRGLELTGPNGLLKQTGRARADPGGSNHTGSVPTSNIHMP